MGVSPSGFPAENSVLILPNPFLPELLPLASGTSPFFYFPFFLTTDPLFDSFFLLPNGF